jgi:hypothetical protein
MTGEPPTMLELRRKLEEIEQSGDKQKHRIDWLFVITVATLAVNILDLFRHW